ncbi:MAG: methylmalonyl-CoA epimerase [Ignavibacteria bacterium]|nr:methylmalonyl-CoA epimerase [Ignavibacteria bacterium]
MKIEKIEHIGIAVKNLEESIPLYENLFGLKCYKIEEVEDQKVKTAFFKIGDTKIELLEATNSDSPIAKFIEKKGEGIHHIAFATNDSKTAIDELKSKDVLLIDNEPRKGAENLDIAFIHPKSTKGVLIELCSEPKREI